MSMTGQEKTIQEVLAAMGLDTVKSAMGPIAEMAGNLEALALGLSAHASKDHRARAQAMMLAWRKSVDDEPDVRVAIIAAAFFAASMLGAAVAAVAAGLLLETPKETV